MCLWKQLCLSLEVSAVVSSSFVCWSERICSNMYSQLNDQVFLLCMLSSTNAHKISSSFHQKCLLWCLPLWCVGWGVLTWSDQVLWLCTLYTCAHKNSSGFNQKCLLWRLPLWCVGWGVLTWSDQVLWLCTLYTSAHKNSSGFNQKCLLWCLPPWWGFCNTDYWSDGTKSCFFAHCHPLAPLKTAGA